MTEGGVIERRREGSHDCGQSVTEGGVTEGSYRRDHGHISWVVSQIPWFQYTKVWIQIPHFKYHGLCQNTRVFKCEGLCHNTMV